MTDADNPLESAIPTDNPASLFDAWFAEAERSEPNDPNAMALATATPTGAPSVRMVLLKGHGATADGGCEFTFYTNAESRKGAEIRANMQASLLFHWKSLRRQIRIEGPLREVTPQSRPLAKRGDYLERCDALAAQYPEGENVPRPAHWTGFTLTAETIEFWLDRPGRMHDRRQFTRKDGAWSSQLLYP